MDEPVAVDNISPPEGLRTASSLRFVFTKRAKEVKVVEICKAKDRTETISTVKEQPKAKKPSGRKQAELHPKKLDQAQEEIKRLKLEWGKAYKGMSEGTPPPFPIFLEFSDIADPFYLKVFREMAYGSFPKGIFFDVNRQTIVCTEPPGKKNGVARRQRMEKYIRVCLPLRPDMPDCIDSKTNNVTMREEVTNDNEENNPVIEDENERYRKAIKFIYRSYQRLELPIGVLKYKYNLSNDRIYQEIKLFIYMMIDLTSPKDSVLLQQDSYQMILTGELISSLRPQRSWKRLNAVEQASLICQYCKACVVRQEGKPIDQLSISQQRILRDIEDYVTGLYQTGCVRASVIEFDGLRVTEIKGLRIHSKGVDIDKSTLFEGFQSPDDPETIAPVVFQRYKTVSLQKISNGIEKQHVKISKMINDMAGENENL
jgi:hypothetical protein